MEKLKQSSSKPDRGNSFYSFVTNHTTPPRNQLNNSSVDNNTFVVWTKDSFEDDYDDLDEDVDKRLDLTVVKTLVGGG